MHFSQNKRNFSSINIPFRSKRSASLSLAHSHNQMHTHTHLTFHHLSFLVRSLRRQSRIFFFLSQKNTLNFYPHWIKIDFEFLFDIDTLRQTEMIEVHSNECGKWIIHIISFPPFLATTFGWILGNFFPGKWIYFAVHTLASLFFSHKSWEWSKRRMDVPFPFISSLFSVNWSLFVCNSSSKLSQIFANGIVSIVNNFCFSSFFSHWPRMVIFDCRNVEFDWDACAFCCCRFSLIYTSYRVHGVYTHSHP